jgi:hypothetical protein
VVNPKTERELDRLQARWGEAMQQLDAHLAGRPDDDSSASIGELVKVVEAAGDEFIVAARKAARGQEIGLGPIGRLRSPDH